MDHRLKLACLSLVIGLIGLGIVALVYDDFALQWQPVPAWKPDRGVLAYASGLLLIAMGCGLIARRTGAASSRVVLVYLLLWLLLLKLPSVVAAPLVEVNWLGFAEIAVIVAAGIVLVATLDQPHASGPLKLATDERGLRIARFIFGLALIPIGLSHFVYASATIGFVPPGFHIARHGRIWAASGTSPPDSGSCSGSFRISRRHWRQR